MGSLKVIFSNVFAAFCFHSLLIFKALTFRNVIFNTS